MSEILSFCIEGHIEYTWYCKDCDKVDQVVQDDVDEPMEAEEAMSCQLLPCIILN